MDNHSKEVRSYNMSHIRSKDNKPEELVRKYLFSKGFRYRKNVKALPGCPDIVLAKYKAVVFINGCFWHMHEGCPKFVWPKSNVEYWTKKLLKNKKRDEESKKSLEELGWKIIIVWECELKKTTRAERLELLCRQITE
jgi:DNA mismatch endonuclease (patch repair protein)